MDTSTQLKLIVKVISVQYTVEQIIHFYIKTDTNNFNYKLCKIDVNLMLFELSRIKPGQLILCSQPSLNESPRLIVICLCGSM